MIGVILHNYKIASRCRNTQNEPRLKQFDSLLRSTLMATDEPSLVHQ